MSANLYLHEVVDIVGEGAFAYMEHTAGFKADVVADRGLTLFGTWYVVGATGRWPQVVNIWEFVDGWDGWHRLLRSTNVQRDENAELARWWREAYEWRRGGVDRLLRGVDGSPRLPDLVASEVRGEIFVHELSQVAPGCGREYLEAVLEEWAPIRSRFGHALVGAYEVLMSDTEVVTLWATDLDGHVAAMAAGGPGGDSEVEQWRARARTWLTGWREELMVPHRGTVLAPPTAPSG